MIYDKRVIMQEYQLINLFVCLAVTSITLRSCCAQSETDLSVASRDSHYSYSSQNFHGRHYVSRPQNIRQQMRRGQRQRHNKHALRLLDNNVKQQGGGLWPAVFNVAANAKITANATCGQQKPEDFCKMVDAHPQRSRAPQCDICDATSDDTNQRHPITHAVDGTNKWWQSPTLYSGQQYEQVTIDIDLGQIYQISSISLKSAISPRPASWILEKSVDGVAYSVWQYFGANEVDCQKRFNMSANNANYVFKTDAEVICSTQFSKLIPLENGEAHVSLLNGRPGANSSSEEFLAFAMARYVRVRLVGMHSSEHAENNVQWLVGPEAMQIRSFYSLRMIKVNGRCYCSGHAAKCLTVAEGEEDDDAEGSGQPKCKCLHNTCGGNCEKCCPLFNQRGYAPGTAVDDNRCEKCECHGHAKSCRYSAEIDERGLSMNVRGKMSGGGVCIDCEKYTTGINCEKCLPNFYRPYDRPPNSETPCVPCECEGIGVAGGCDNLGGDCHCKEGYTGPKCTHCLSGYRGENCTKCSCDVRGTMPGGECESHCQCKLHVESEHCDKCVSGYFSLNSDNPEGCLKCFCSGVGTSCRSSNIEAKFFETLVGWNVTDITKSVSTYPSRDNDTGFMVFGMYELPDVEAVYWSAPPLYLGNRLTSYGSRFVYKLGWVIVRGDTSGKPTSGPSIILIGKNGLKIAYGDETFTTSNETFNVQLSEDGWYHVPRAVKDIVTRLKRTEYKGDPVTRVQFMSVLSDVESVLLRGTFHTDQVESVLEKATLHVGSNEISDSNSLSLVEECSCPPGYTGLSCETCDFGYMKIYERSATHEMVGKCIKCPCNGHAATCDLETGKCGECQHNTFGESCSRCASGYYGNALEGTPNDCKRCACPLKEMANNFSPSCKVNEVSVEKAHFYEYLVKNETNSVDFVCTQCPDGYTGNHCEVCDDGYFGDPTELGSFCRPCPCGDSVPCDPVSGECIVCLNNTEGWRCERCMAGYWGDAKVGCEPCACSDSGAVNNICDQMTGECECKSRYAGQHCDECDLGFGNLELDCPSCDCNTNGSLSAICDLETGQCTCREGVEGVQCDTCMEFHYGLSETGCQGCNCHIHGSQGRLCDYRTGQCKCKPNVEGRTCDRCTNGHWNIDSNVGCIKCACNSVGSDATGCDSYSGQCFCKPGVEGLNCDRCQTGHYGFSHHGCKRCDVCDSPAYVCDTDTGRCVCPPMSQGPNCKSCIANTWGNVYQKGCRSCDCDMLGSVGQSCDPEHGQCSCKEGYAGRRCDYCAAGYYGYPSCKRCGCDTRGSIALESGAVECDEFGQCPCKELVTGLKCDTCRQATFGLAHFNPLGCTRCFCFGRSQECIQNDLSWGQIRAQSARNLSIEYSSYHMDGLRHSRQDYEYVVVMQIEGAKTNREDAEIKTKNNLNLIPSSTGNVSIGSYVGFYYPLYFQLPPQFLGDQIRSYGGLIKFSLTTVGWSANIPEDILRQHPLIQLHSHRQLILDYYSPEIFESHDQVTYKALLHESKWRYHYNGHKITRAILMTALQNIKHIFLRATMTTDFREVVLSNVTMDTGIYVEGATNNVAYGVEQCRCPDKYNGTSCQNAAMGYFRWKNSTSEEDDGAENTIEDFIGHVVPCRCNKRSETCDTETGHCFNCRGNTGGKHCELCAEGYYGNPKHGQCQPCPCPETRKNFARGCTVRENEVSCICKEGYTGRLCEQCMAGFYGSPHLVKGSCESCDCNKEGVRSQNCDVATGQCDCKPGVSGKRCDQCVEARHVLQDNQCKHCDNCTTTLLDTLDDMLVELDRGANHIDRTGIPAPWKELDKYINQSNVLDDRLRNYNEMKYRVENFDETAVDKVVSKAKNLKSRSSKLSNKLERRAKEVQRMLVEAKEMLGDTKGVRTDIDNTIEALNRYGTNDHHIKLPKATQEASHHLKDIKSKMQGLNQTDAVLHCAKESFKFWTNASFESESINIGRNNTKLTLHELQDRLKDMKKHTHRTLSTVDSAAATQTKNKVRHDNLKEKFDEIRGLEADVEDKLNNSLTAQSETMLEMIGDNLHNIEVDVVDLQAVNKEMNDTLTEVGENLQHLKGVDLPNAKQHVANLLEKSNSFAELFRNTKEGAEIAMMASTAHQNISTAIKAAVEAAEKAVALVQQAEDQIFPADKKSIMEQGAESIQESQNIELEALAEIEKLDDLEDKLQGHETIIDNVKTAIWQAGLKNNEIASALKPLANNETMKEVRVAMETSMKVSDHMKEVRREAIDINNDVYKLKQKLSDLEPEWEAKLGMAAENVSNSRSNIRTANSTLHNIEMHAAKHNEKIKAWNDTMSVQLKALRDKIAQAKHAAEGIRVSIESRDPKCIRSYLPSSFGPTTSTTIVMSIALSTKDGNSPLVFIQGEDNKFIALEMIKRKIRMLWNFGGDTGVVTHLVEIETRDPKYDDAWYQIEANRTMNVGSLNVRRMTSNGELEPGAVITGVSQPAFSRLTFDITNRIFLGGVPDDVRPKDLLNSNGLNVVISQLSVDQKHIGLWSFVHSEGNCGGEMLGARESSATSNARHFNGEGYSVVGRNDANKLQRKLTFSVQMAFKTRDENALLFLAVDEINNRSVSLTLFEGRIVFRIDYGGESKLEINTTKKYNTGEWVDVATGREYKVKGSTEEGVLRVNNLEPKFGSPTTPITQKMIPDFKSSLYYLGGVPPGFSSGSTKAPGADYAFLGCMKDVLINGATYDPLESSQYYGVESSCKERITRAGFYGNGFVELPSHSLRRAGNFGMVFRTLQPECLLLLSAYPPDSSLDFDGQDIRGNYSVSLVGGRVVVWMDAGKGRIELSSNMTLNDGEYHVINVVKKGRKIDLRVNDELQMTKNLPSSPVAVHAPEEIGGLYIGGAPDFAAFDLLAPTFVNLEGAIKDVVFNNKSVSFDQALNISNVHLGRIGPSMGSQGLQMALMKTEPIGRSFKATPEGCHRVGSYSYETNAFKFGDGMFSHSIVNVASRHLWQKNFNIQFDFRTFYPNGVLLAAPGTKEKQKHFIVLALRDGILSLIVRGRRKQSLSLPLKLNDGQWHRVMLHSVERKVTLGIEFGNSKQYSSAQIRLPKKLNASNMMFIGGIAENSLTLPQELVAKLEGFKGCIRKLIINNSTQDLAKPGRHHNVGQCFPRVEKGAYFPGDAYAVYKRNFNFGKYMELELEFRTSDLNGILVSIAEPVGFPALSLELNNGNIVMSCDLGDGNPFRVETALASKYALCDNQWHNITALYESEQIAIRIDNQPSIIALAHRMSGKVHSKSPLYIGGLPEIAPTGTLLLRENFKGCIRNVVVRNELRDWTDMDSLHNVLLSECLTVH